MNVIKFQDFLYEDGDGGGIAGVNGGNIGGMNNVSSPGVAINGMTNTYSGNGHPTDAAPRGSGDKVAHAVGTSTKQNGRIKKGKKKHQLTPKNVRMSGTNAPKESMYVTSFADWSGSGINENNEVGLWKIYHGLGGGFGGATEDDEPFEGTEEQANNFAWELACFDYEQYSGMYGLREISQIMEEDEVEEEEAEQIYADDRESLIDYWVEKY